jgi:hemolysin activation/secretion protein
MSSTGISVPLQSSSLGWHNTLLIEHSNPAVGSDFDFTRFQLQLRYAASRGDDIIRTRLVLGAATSALPIQRQFIIGGRGTLSGYPLYAFAGDHVSLLNLEYFYRLPMPNPYGWEWLKHVKTFLVLFLDQGQVWTMSDKPYRFDPKTSVGIGLQLGQESPLRFNLSKPLESERGVQFDLMWYSGF